MEIKCLDCNEVLITRQELVNNLLTKKENDVIICKCKLRYGLDLLKEMILNNYVNWEKIRKHKLFRRDDNYIIVAQFSDGEPTHPDVMDLHYKFLGIK